ncbi:hypothetical protein QO010_002297 [Caulobacter ginsengisoli]|uniref:Tat pathway signal protein n=1 Tax=Caulobacter ginsengisoli TaxID=400775 RepID=A0ABU0IR71_9CAUL|nr:hypothetical protein [Caulobacter ginsengisoli]MDQ0464516.1 hypothetical protein [Caulobacter ginsengisoli]
MTIDRRFLLAGLATAAVPGLALAESKTIPAKKIFQFLDLYLGIPPAERNRFTLAYYLKRDGKPWSGAGFTLIGANGVRTPLPVGPNGRFTRTPTLADLKAGAQIEITAQGEGKFQLNMQMEPLVPMAEVMNAGDFAAAIAQCGTAIKKNAGVLGFAAPKITQVAFVGVPAGTAVLPGGKTAALPLFKTLPAYNPANLKGASQLRFAKPPARAVLV